MAEAVITVLNAGEDVQKAHVVFGVQKIGKSREVEMWGMQFTVFPAVLVQEKVLNNNLGPTFLPGEEIEQSVRAWNMMPVVIRHPSRRGVYISARDPKVFNAVGVGFLFNTSYDKEPKALKADVYLSKDRIEKVPDAKVSVNTVEDGKAGELSTAFNCALDETPGVFDGEEYKVVLRDIDPDHLALLPDAIGACSVADGCGLGVNEKEEVTMATSVKEPMPCPDSVEKPEPPPEPPVTNDASWWRKVVKSFVNYFKVENASDEERRAAISEALQERFGGYGVWVWAEAIYSDDGTVVFSRDSPTEGISLLRTTFEISGDYQTVTLGDQPEEVRRVITYAPVSNEKTDGAQNKEKDTMATKKDQEGAPSAAENAVGEGSPDSQSSGAAPPVAEPKAETKTAENSELVAALNRLTEEVSALRTQSENDRKEIADLRKIAEPLVNERAAQKEQLVKQLTGNSRCPFTADELNAKDSDELTKLLSMMRGVSYAGRGAPQALNVGEPAFAEPKSPWAAPAAAQNGKEN